MIYGHDTTLPISLDTMIAHAQAVMRAKPKALVVVDLPFGSYEASKEQALASAAARAQGGGRRCGQARGWGAMAETIAFLTARAVPVMGHIGLLPQSTRVLGGYKLAGRDRGEWPQSSRMPRRSRRQARSRLSSRRRSRSWPPRSPAKSVKIPTIGIGASPACDGQVLVIDDMLGITGRPARFVRTYANLREIIGAAAKAYAEDVRKRRFPAAEETYPAAEQMSRRLTAHKACSPAAYAA